VLNKAWRWLNAVAKLFILQAIFFFDQKIKQYCKRVFQKSEDKNFSQD